MAVQLVSARVCSELNHVEYENLEYMNQILNINFNVGKQFHSNLLSEEREPQSP